MAAVFVLAVASDRNGCCLSQGGKQENEMSRLRALHFSAVAIQEGVQGQPVAHKIPQQLAARRQHGQPDVEVVQPGIVLLLNATRQIANGPQTESLASPAGRAQPDTLKMQSHLVVLSDRLQCLVEIGDQVLDVLDAG